MRALLFEELRLVAPLRAIPLRVQAHRQRPNSLRLWGREQLDLCVLRFPILLQIEVLYFRGVDGVRILVLAEGWWGWVWTAFSARKVFDWLPLNNNAGKILFQTWDLLRMLPAAVVLRLTIFILGLVLLWRADAKGLYLFLKARQGGLVFHAAIRQILLVRLFHLVKRRWTLRFERTLRPWRGGGRFFFRRSFFYGLKLQFLTLLGSLIFFPLSKSRRAPRIVEIASLSCIWSDVSHFYC